MNGEIVIWVDVMFFDYLGNLGVSFLASRTAELRA